MKFIITSKKLSSLLLLVAALLMLSPAVTFSAASSVGEVPVVQPLRPPEVGVSPNYSKNIEDDGTESTSVETKESVDAEQSDLAQAAPNQEVSSSNWKTWVITTLVILVILSLIGFVVWKKKIITLSNE